MYTYLLTPWVLDFNNLFIKGRFSLFEGPGALKNREMSGNVFRPELVMQNSKILSSFRFRILENFQIFENVLLMTFHYTLLDLISQCSLTREIKLNTIF